MATFDQLRRTVYSKLNGIKHQLVEMRPPEFQKLVTESATITSVPTCFTQHDGVIFVWPRKAAGITIEWKWQ